MSGSGLGIRPVRKQIRQVRKHERMGHGQDRHRKNLALARFGSPQRLFKDSDRDGVANVFDCKPFNKKKQDVMSPTNFGGGVSQMYNRRENSRLNRVYQHQMREAQRLEMERLKELQRIGQLPVQIVDNSRIEFQSTPYVYNAAGKLVAADSKEGQKIRKDYVDSRKPIPKADSNTDFMQSLGYVGTKTAGSDGNVKTVWTKAPTSVLSRGGRSSGSSGSSGGGGYTYSSPTSSSGGSSSYRGPGTTGFVGPTKPANYSPPKQEAPKQSMFQKVASLFRRR